MQVMYQVATVVTKTFLWNLTFEQKYLSRESEW